MIRPRLRAAGLAALTVCLVQMFLPAPALVHAATENMSGSATTLADVGFVGPAYTGTTAPTGQKPQSKLWVADGTWWGSLWDTSSRDFKIFRYDWTANTWTNTGVVVEDRAGSYLDALWDGSHLYVASAGPTASNSAQSPRLARFSYDPATDLWSRDAGYPVTIGSGGVEAAVLAKASDGLLWVTYTQGSRVWLTHSVSGRDDLWIPRFQLPTPGNEANVDPDDISAIVAYDGDKIGVLWSNQRNHIMYWAAHIDATPDQAWTLQIAYQQPEGADDHMNLKALVGDSAGRAFAVAKTSMDAAADPLFNLLVLTSGGQWISRVISTQVDDHTRAILQIDTEARELYFFAAAPCCAGGTIYYKKASLDNPVFQPGLGTAFIHSAAHPEANNPTSTKQNLTGTTGLLVLAGDDETRRYLYNRLSLGGPPPADTEPPETTITSAPPPATTSSGDATFRFTSSEPGSTFRCSLDGQPAASCTSPTNYTGLPVGSHTFTVAATDAAGNTDPSPATHAWSIQQSTPPIFADDFSSGGFTAGGWTVHTGGGGTAGVVAGAVNAGDLGARLTSTTATGATASVRKALGTSYAGITLTFDAKVAAAGTTDTYFALAKIYNGSGTRQLSLLRVAGGELRVQFGASTVTTSGTLVDGRIARISIRMALGASADAVVITVDGVAIYSSASADLGSVGFANLRMGDDSLRRNLDYRFDQVAVTE